MTANKMPEMPPIYVHRCDGDVFRCLDGNGCECEMAGRPPQRCDYTASQTEAYGRACYLAGLEAAKACVPAQRFRDEYDEDIEWASVGGHNDCRNKTLTNLTALEQEAKK